MSDLDDFKIMHSGDLVAEDYPWGQLVWQVSGDLGNSTSLTVGRCIIRPKQANGRHVHPTCDEVLEVIRGSIVHSWNDREFALGRGDTISIPAGIVHNARNDGDEDAELLIIFSTAFRTAVAAE